MKDITEQTTQVNVEPGIFVTINLPDPDKGERPLVSPIVMQRGNRVQWRYGEKFSVNITPDVFDKTFLSSQQQSDGSFLTEPARVIGPKAADCECSYVLESGQSISPANTPPPPNDIIVDSSTPGFLDRLRRELIARVTAIETDQTKLKLLIDAINVVLKISSEDSQPETANRNGRTPK